jgi:predicted transcriptional regulator
VSLSKGETAKKDTLDFREKYELTYDLALGTQEFKESYFKDKIPYAHFYLIIDNKGIVQESLSTHKSGSLNLVEKRLGSLLSSGSE